jgi:hypothetical protein
MRAGTAKTAEPFVERVLGLCNDNIVELRKSRRELRLRVRSGIR